MGDEPDFFGFVEKHRFPETKMTAIINMVYSLTIHVLNANGTRQCIALQEQFDNVPLTYFC